MIQLEGHCKFTDTQAESPVALGLQSMIQLEGHCKSRRRKSPVGQIPKLTIHDSSLSPLQVQSVLQKSSEPLQGGHRKFWLSMFNGRHAATT
jgi:hypothetical protein